MKISNLLKGASLISCLFFSQAAVTTEVAYQVGTMEKELLGALEPPFTKKSLTTIRKYGEDSRYYTMVREWLMKELSWAETQEETKAVKENIAFLKKAIRRIDLE